MVHAKNYETVSTFVIVMQKQENRAIAKMTARCALYIDALKNFGSHWLRPQLLFLKLLRAFVAIDRMKVPTQFDVRSFARS